MSNLFEFSVAQSLGSVWQTASKKAKNPSIACRRRHVPHVAPKDSAMDNAKANSCGRALTFFV